MKKKILHIIQDQKFTDSAYELFESVAEGLSDYVLPEKSKTIKYLKNIKPKRISRFSFLNPLFRKSLEKYDVVILHALTDFNCELVARSANKVNFLWVGLGHDYYDLIYQDKALMLGAQTLNFVVEHIPQFLSNEPRSPFKKFVHNMIYSNNKNKLDILKKITWFSPVLETEYYQVKESLDNVYPFPDYVDWNYALTANLINSDLLGLDQDACNILVGNSASPFNNHLEIFGYLKSLKLPESTKLIVPLSYGKKEYRDMVRSEGEKIWGDKFIPLTEFLSYQDYMQIIATCSTVIMNHYRQQAGGNIAAGLYMGAKVFLNRKNSFYDEFKNNGAVILDIEMLREEQNILGQPLQLSDVKKNREVVVSLRSLETVMTKTKNLIQTVGQQISL